MRAEELELKNLAIEANTPAGTMCLDQYEIKDLAAFKKSCDVCRLDLKSTQNTLKKCVDHGAPATAWWADPKIVVGGIAISLGLGAIIGMAIAK